MRGRGPHRAAGGGAPSEPSGSARLGRPGMLLARFPRRPGALGLFRKRCRTRRSITRNASWNHLIGQCAELGGLGDVKLRFRAASLRRRTRGSRWTDRSARTPRSQFGIFQQHRRTSLGLGDHTAGGGTEAQAATAAGAEDEFLGQLRNRPARCRLADVDQVAVQRVPLRRRNSASFSFRCTSRGRRQPGARRPAISSPRRAGPPICPAPG